MADVVQLFQKSDDTTSEHISELEREVSFWNGSDSFTPDELALQRKKARSQNFMLIVDSYRDMLDKRYRDSYTRSVVEFVHKGANNLHYAIIFAKQLAYHNGIFFEPDGKTYGRRQRLIDDSSRLKAITGKDAFNRSLESYILLSSEKGKTELRYLVDSVTDMDKSHTRITGHWAEGLSGTLMQLRFQRAKIFEDEARYVLDTNGEASGIKYLKRLTKASRKRFEELAV